MRISPINFISNTFAPRQINKASKLSPLAYDTVSFSAKKDKTKEVKTSEKEINPNEGFNMELSRTLNYDSDIPFHNFKNLISEIFDASVVDIYDPNMKKHINRIYSANRELDKPIVLITARRKTPTSISEKMTTKYVRNKDEAKDKLYDILGARVIVSGTGQKEGNFVIDKLIEATKKGKIKVSKVTNHGQKNTKLNYATEKKLKELVDVARKNGSSLCVYSDEPRDTGYLAVHVILDNVQDNFKGEIQIMGVDVDNFKDLEDFCYKCKGKKGIPKEYNEIKKLLKPLKEDKDLEAEYNEYTKRAYAYERSKSKHKLGTYTKFLEIPPDLAIPEELDFNNINKLKIKIDNEIKAGKKA